jgi:predicted permease
MRWPWQRAEDELDLELRFHLETLTDGYERQGLSRPAALAQARRDLGQVESFKDQCRDLRWWHWLDELARDIRFSTRMLRRAPAITLTVTLSLALGIGATAAIVSLADLLLWRSLGVPQPEQLVEILWETNGPAGLSQRSRGGNYREGAMQVADYFSLRAVDAMRRAAGSLASVTSQMGEYKASVSVEGRVAVVLVRPVAGDFFNVLGVAPARGRLFQTSDDAPSAPRVVVLSHRFWRERLGSAPNIVGRPLRINNNIYEIAGILPPTFRGITAGDAVELYTTIWQSPPFLEPNSTLRAGATDPLVWWLHPLARRAPGVPPERLQAALNSAFVTSWTRTPRPEATVVRLRLSSATRGLGPIRREFGKPIQVLLTLVALVLLAACANIANLLLARGVSREKEVALRVSLGGGRARLVRQFLTESLMLALLGGLASVPVSMAIIWTLSRLVTTNGMAMVIPIEPDWRSLACAALLTGSTALLFGFYPAWRAAALDTTPILKRLAGGAATSLRFHWTPARLLVLAQITVGVVLMTTAVLFTGNLWELVHRETGFDRGNVVMFSVRPGELGYQDARLRQFYQALERRLAQVPGVRHAGMSNLRPMSRSGWWDQASLSNGAKLEIAVHHISPGFLDALQVPIIAGRAPTREQLESGARVAVVSEDFAARMGPQNVLGARLSASGFGKESLEVVGVARNARYADMKRAVPVVYTPFDYEQGTATVVLGTSAPPLGLLPAIRQAAAEINRDLPLIDLYTMEEQISRTLEHERLFAWLCGGFGALALVLCVVGLYGLLAHAMARQTHEIGVRMALGASRSGILWRTLRGGLGLTLAGLLLGVPPALYALRAAVQAGLIAQGPVPTGPLAAALALIATAAVLAALLPALRAASIDPHTALRQE